MPIQQLNIMLADLESNRLEVVLVPQRRYTNEGGMIRVAASKNCTWYRSFCARHQSSRMRGSSSWDTKIRRQDTIWLLQRLIDGLASRSKYVDELVAVAQRMARAA